jgi:hypothetical protein
VSADDQTQLHSSNRRTRRVCIANAAAGDDEGGGGRVDPAGVAARQKIFGIENVDARSGRVRDDDRWRKGDDGRDDG